MKKDLDRLMEERGLDAAVLSGSVEGNPNMVYMLSGAHVSGGTVIKKRGEEPVFLHSPIERDEAKASGLELINTIKYDFMSILREKGDPLEAQIEFHRRVYAELGVQGRVGYYGTSDQGRAHVFLSKLDQELPDIQVQGEFDEGLFEVARATKDADEVVMIKEVARLTAEVMTATMDFVRGHRVEDETLMTDDGTPLTIGMVHKHIGRLLAERRMEDPGGVIFAIARDAGVPHSRGTPEDPLRLGQTIIYDLFPRKANGYHFDCTRTFCLGYAPPEVEKTYQEVKQCVDTVIDAVKVGLEARSLQQLTCEFFEDLGHATVGSDSKVEEGYVHSIGHGLGLAVHEEPWFTDAPSNDRLLEPGHVFTVEPGLYYPDSGGYGVRIEDVVWIDEQGEVHNLTDVPYQLVLEMS